MRKKRYIELRWGRNPWDPIIHCIITYRSVLDDGISVDLHDPDLGDYVKSFDGKCLNLRMRVVYKNEFAQFIFNLGKEEVGTIRKAPRTKFKDGSGHMENCPRQKHLREKFMKNV